MKEILIKNAKIKSTYLGIEDHGIFTAFLHLDFGGYTQSFGGYTLDKYVKDGRRSGHAFGTEFIMQILRVLEIESWEKLPGTVCRVRSGSDPEHYNSIEEIGHFMKDQWFNPKSLAEKYFPLQKLEEPPMFGTHIKEAIKILTHK